MALISEEGSVYTILIDSVDGVLSLNVDPYDTIHALKLQIQNQQGIAPQNQTLIFNGIILEDHRVLVDYDVQHESTINLRFSPIMPSHYRASFYCGIYGAFTLSVIDSPQDDDEKEETEVDLTHQNDQIQREIEAITSHPQTSRANVFRLAKQTYQQRGCPVVIDPKNTLENVRQHSSNYNNVALPLILAQDRDFSTWNEQSFKEEFSATFSIPMECIQITSVRSGSTIIDLKLKTHSNGNKLLIPIECIAEHLSKQSAQKALVEFGIFAMEFGEPTAGFDATNLRVIMNPQWNREYGPGHTDWDGPLQDGKSRGGEAYYCPKGWKRFAVQFSTTAYDFKNVYDKWPIAYHGTKFNVHMMITLSGLKAFPGAYGCAVYLSPSIKYISHQRYCAPIKLDLNKETQANWTSQHRNEFMKYNGKWIQCAYACRVKPGEYEKKGETMGLGANAVFDNIDKNTIEWIVRGQHGEVIGSDKILIYGFMIKASDTCPTGYN